MLKFKNSDDLLNRSLKIIPTGSQTFSKSYYSLPRGGAPLFLESGNGCKVTDVDGNEFIDLVNGLLCVSLGYQDPDVDLAIKNQLKKGISFSLPHTLEIEVADLLVELIPSADMVRFGKNGTDVTSAAIRLARAYTNRNHVAVCGYHGWQDWYIATTSRKLGVPKEVGSLSHTFEYNNLDSLKSLLSQNADMAAVILEPMNVEFPSPKFLQGVRDLCDQHGVVLIFDEMITGFRFGLSGAQGLFGVTPDLSTFGKGMANGMPLSAIVGKQDIMSLMDDIFFSGTFGGETLSLAAAKASIEKMKRENVIEHLHKLGKYLNDGVQQVIDDLGVKWLNLSGHDVWKVLSVNANENTNLYKSLLIQELARRGVLTIGSHNLSYAMSYHDADSIISAYKEALYSIENAIKDNQALALLSGECIQPVFKVR